MPDARTLLLTQADLPAPWAATSHRADTNYQQIDASLARCLGVRRTVFSTDAVATQADAPDFAAPNTPQHIADHAAIDTSAATLDDEWNELDRPTFDSCLQQAFHDALAAATTGATVKDVTVRPLAVTPSSAGTRAVRLSVTLAVGTFTVTVIDDVVFVRRGAAITRLTFSGSPDPIASALEGRLAAVVAARTRAAVG